MQEFSGYEKNVNSPIGLSVQKMRSDLSPSSKGKQKFDIKVFKKFLVRANWY